jgi:large subunit ribosomal protein L22
MAKLGYSVKMDPKTTARGIAREVPISPKKSYELCNVLRGKTVDEAKRILDDIIALRKPIRFRRYTTAVGHKRGIGPGRYPVKPARYFKKLIMEVQANAEQQGLDSENMKIAHIAIHPGPKRKMQRPRAFGRSTAWNQETVHIELILEELKEE